MPMRLSLFLLIAVAAVAKPDPAVTAKAGRILVMRCSGCHGKRVTERGINVLDRKILIGVGVLQPGSEDSTLLQVIESGRMPLHGPPLKPEEVAVVRQWIIEGARQFKGK